jgi:hypothetical protein
VAGDMPAALASFCMLNPSKPFFTTISIAFSLRAASFVSSRNLMVLQI